MFNRLKQWLSAHRDKRIYAKISRDLNRNISSRKPISLVLWGRR